MASIFAGTESGTEWLETGGKFGKLWTFSQVRGDRAAFQKSLPLHDFVASFAGVLDLPPEPIRPQNATLGRPPKPVMQACRKDTNSRGFTVLKPPRQTGTLWRQAEFLKTICKRTCIHSPESAVLVPCYSGHKQCRRFESQPDNCSRCANQAARGGTVMGKRKLPPRHLIISCASA